MKSQVRSRRRFAIEPLELRRVLASDYLLEIDGIKGESTDAKHAGAIELSSFSWGASAPRNGPAARFSTEEFRFLADTSKASPLLYSAAAQGKHIAKAVLYVRKAGGDQQEYLKVQLSDILVSSVQSRSLNEETPKDEVAFSFSKIEQTFVPTEPDGSAGPPEVSSWSVPGRGIKFEPTETLLSQRPSSNNDQTDAFLKIEGIQGDSTDAKHPGTIDIESYSWGVTQSSAAGGGGGGGAGRATFQDFHFVARVSKASPLLARSVASGQHIKQAELTVRRGSSENPSDFLTIKLSDILVSSIKTVGSSETETLEEFTLSFNKMGQAVSVQDAAGRPGTTVVANLDAPREESEGDSLLPKTVAAAAQSDMFLKIDGIKGESTASDHKNEIDIESFSWGLSQQGTAGRGGGGGAGKVTVQDFSFTSHVNKASPLLMQAVADGKHIKFAELSVRKAGGQQQDYLTYTLEDLLVSSYSTQSLNNDVPTDSFSLNFTKVEFRYDSPSADGSVGSSTGFNWSFGGSAQHVPNTVPTPVSPPIVSEPGTRAAADFLLEIDGIKGESSVEDHKGAIEIQSFSWGMTQSGGFAGGGGGGAGKVSMQDFHFVAPVSSASPQLFQAVAGGGQHIKKATLFVRKSGSDQEYLKIELNDLLIDSLKVQATNNTQPTEEFTLNFAKMEVRYRTQSDTGRISSVSASLAPNGRNTLPGESILDATKPQEGSFDYFLKIDGIKGESTDAKHKNQIEVDSFSWGVSQTTRNFGGGGGGGAGKVAMQDFHFVMRSSSASPQLVDALFSGEQFDAAQLLVRRAGDGNTDPVFLKYELEDVLISSYQVSGTENHHPEEEIALNFGGIGQRYRLQKPDGSLGGVTAASWVQGKLPASKELGASILDKTTASRDSSSYFLKIRGLESSNQTRHKDWIELTSFSWGASRTINTRGRSRLGGLSLDDFEFQTDYDKATPSLMEALVDGQRFRSAILEVVAAEQTEAYMKIKLTDLLVSSFSAQATAPGDPTSSFELDVTAVDMAYEDPQSSDGLLTAQDSTVDQTADEVTDWGPLADLRSSFDDQSKLNELFEALG